MKNISIAIFDRFACFSMAFQSYDTDPHEFASVKMRLFHLQAIKYRPFRSLKNRVEFLESPAKDKRYLGIYLKHDTIAPLNMGFLHAVVPVIAFSPC